MNKLFKAILISVFFIVCSLSLNAQSIDPVAIRLTENGVYLEKPDTITPGGEAVVGPAPMQVEFKANVKVPDDYTYRCEWFFSDRQLMDDPNQNSALFQRYDEDTEYTFEEAKTYYIRLYVTFIKGDGSSEEASSDTFVIQISESELEVPNAFSPNGDGINDVFKVTYKSLVKFNAYIYNRWGQELYHWTLANIDEGWDGTAHGKPVKDGVYFIVVEAEGSDGVKYKHKGDINILRGFSGTGSISTSK